MKKLFFFKLIIILLVTGFDILGFVVNTSIVRSIREGHVYISRSPDVDTSNDPMAKIKELTESFCRSWTDRAYQASIYGFLKVPLKKITGRSPGKSTKILLDYLVTGAYHFVDPKNAKKLSNYNQRMNNGLKFMTRKAAVESTQYLLSSLVSRFKNKKASEEAKTEKPKKKKSGFGSWILEGFLYILYDQYFNLGVGGIPVRYSWQNNR